MPVAEKNLAASVRSKLNRGYPDIGQIYYMIDSDFRTGAQGWSKADRTGPLDLWAGQNNQGTEYVYRTGDYTDDSTALQAAMDAAVDFRGDIIHFTPGAYSLGTVITVDCPNIRLLGPPVANPKGSRATLTGTVADALTVSVDDVELGFLRFVPLTAAAILSITTGADYGFAHNYHYDSRGVAANTGTEFVDADDTTTGWLFERGFMIVDAQQGDFFTLDGAIEWELNDLTFYTKVAAYATAMTLGTNCEGNIVRRAVVSGDADGTMTNFITGETNSNSQIMFLECYVNDVTIASHDDFETGFGTDTDIQMGRCWQAQSDAAGGGLAIDLG